LVSGAFSLGSDRGMLAAADTLSAAVQMLILVP